MPLVKSITPKSINVLGVGRTLLIFLLLACIKPVFSQDNSPYSRYGLGDLVPNTNVLNRGLGGISAGYNNIYVINYSNPATYGSFETIKEQRAKKILVGRAILDVGLNFESRTLREPSNVNKFTASNALFSHVQIGVPLKPNWGLSFGLRPLTRVSYNMSKVERLNDPNTGLPIDSALTNNKGDGGSYIASIGTGYRIKFTDFEWLSFGVNVGYLFGKKDIQIRRAFLNDTVSYNSGNFQTLTTYGGVYFNGGIQYQTRLPKDIFLTLGAFGNIKQKIDARQDIIRETYYYDENVGYPTLDSVFRQEGIKGQIEYPASYTAGFVLQRYADTKKSGWLIGIDYSQHKWSGYTSYGLKDPNVTDGWNLKAGAQFSPLFRPTSYLSRVSYRAGLGIGKDYVLVGNDLPTFSASLGMGLPIEGARTNPGQFTLVNLAFEFIKRGNNDNILKENMFRVSLGLSLSDYWFRKKKYD